MIYQIQGYPASTLCFDEEQGVIYMDSSGVRSLRFPALDNAVEISTMQNTSLYLSDDGKCLGIFDTENRLEIYDLQAGNGKLTFKKEWIDTVASCKFCCTDGQRLFVPIQNTLHCLDLHSPGADRVIYGGEYGEASRKCWHDVGHITSLSYYNGEIALMHYTFKHNWLVRINAADCSVIDRFEVPSDLGTSFSYVAYDQKGGLCLSGKMGAPILHYKTFPKDIHDPDNAIRLSDGVLAYLGLRFSPDGEYLTFQALVGGANFSEAWLVGAKDWSVIQTIADRRILYTPSFSSKGRYWLIPDKHPMIVDLESHDE